MRRLHQRFGGFAARFVVNEKGGFHCRFSIEIGSFAHGVCSNLSYLLGGRRAWRRAVLGAG
jgi:hypothetical protein